MLKATPTERLLMREAIHDKGRALYVWPNPDGTWACEVGGIVFEGPSAAEVLRELADICEEA